MRLYPKRLHSIEDLEKEKQLLLKKSKELDKEDFLSMEGLLGKGKSKKNDKSESGSILDLLPISNPIVSSLIKMIGGKIFKKSKKSATVNVPPPPGEKKNGNSKLKSVAIEFIGGYLKWKAIELSYKGIRHLIRKQKEKAD